MPQASQIRILAASLMAALLVIGVALFVVISAVQDVAVLPPTWVLLTQVTAGLAVHFLLEAAGYRTVALDPQTPEDDARRTALLAFQARMIFRFALSEVIAIASVAAAFVLSEGGFMAYVSGALISLMLMIVHVWPGARPVLKTSASLERDGGRSHLPEAFGLA